METLYLYIFATIALLIPGAGYFVFDRFYDHSLPNYQKIKNLIIRGIALMGAIFIALTIFFQKGVMITENSDTPGHFVEGVGCIHLKGAPYGGNEFVNFLAWFNQAITYPGAVVIILLPFLPFTSGKLLNRFIELPIAIISFATTFNLCFAFNGDASFMFRNVFIAVQNGLILALSIILAYDSMGESIFDNSYHLRDYGAMIGLFLIAFLATLPVNTFATLFSTEGIMLGDYQVNLRIYPIPGHDMHPSFIHRLVLYAVVIFPLIIYFFYRDSTYEARKSILLVISFGCLMCFTSDFGFDQLFPVLSDGTRGFDVNKIPLHLCNTALYVLPICLIFPCRYLRRNLHGSGSRSSYAGHHHRQEA